MAGTAEDPDLETLGIWPADAAARLRAAWVTSAAQLTALAATSGGAALIAQTTGLPQHDVDARLARTRASLPAATAEAMSRPADTSQQYLGALPPKD